MIRVVDVDYIKDYTLEMTFSDGVRKRNGLRWQNGLYQQVLRKELVAQLIDPFVKRDEVAVE